MNELTKEQAWDAWISYMRSDEACRYEGSLESYFYPNKRCCLGHACHALCAERTLIGYHEVDGLTDVMYDVIYGENRSNSTDLPREVAKLLDITPNGLFREPIEIPGYYEDDGETVKFRHLIALNDTTLLMPDKLADIIEEQHKKDNFWPYYSDPTYSNQQEE